MQKQKLKSKSEKIKIKIKKHTEGQIEIGKGIKNQIAKNRRLEDEELKKEIITRIDFKKKNKKSEVFFVVVVVVEIASGDMV